MDGITASGIKATEGRTVGSWFAVWDGFRDRGFRRNRVVEDRGVLGKHIDIFINDHNRCIEFGRKGIEGIQNKLTISWSCGNDKWKWGIKMNRNLFWWSILYRIK